MKALQFPIIKVAIFVILGILFSFYNNPKPNLAFSMLLVGFLVFAFSFILSLNQYSKKTLFGISTLLLSFLIGLTAQVIQNQINNKNHYINQINKLEKLHFIEITLKEKLKFSEFNNRFLANVNRLDNKISEGKIILNIRKDSTNLNAVDIGSILKITAKINKNKPIKNPNQFDYGKYLENKNIFAQVYCNENEIQISNKINKDIWYYSAKFRNTIIHNLEKKGFGKDELAVIVALILGQQQDISQEILEDYQLAGAVHILSVSGLHVGFILVFIGYLLKPFPNTRKWKINKLIIVIISLWIFGFIAGLAPSVLRSVVMFSFVAFGRYLGRGINVYNTLLVSALLILLYQPSYLFDVGFQLSYISLFFILWLNPLIYDLWQTKNKILNFFWEIMSVSISAQIGAMGLSIYYFHQFPGLFFITNMIILPVMGFILGYGVFVMILAYFDFIPVFLIKILEYSIWFLNQIIAQIASFEQFILTDIAMNKTMLCAIYLMIFSIIIYLKKPNFTKMIVALIGIILFQISIFSSKFYHQKQQELIVFNANKQSIISERISQNTTVYANNSLFKTNKINSNINQYLVGNFSKIVLQKIIPKLLFFKNKKILILDNNLINPENLNPDVMIITNSPRLNLERFLQVCKPKIIVADASNFKSYVKVWKSTCEKSAVEFHSTSEKGYFRLD